MSRDHMFKVQRLTDDQWFQIIENLVLAVEKLHDKGITHNDIKEDNILVDPDLGVHLIDLGIALPCGRNIGITCTEPKSYPWMAPEVLNNGACTPASDI